MSTALLYHQATKYAPESMGAQADLDWSQQPRPYKDYDCARAVDLAPFLPLDPNPFTGQGRGDQADDAKATGLRLEALARLLWYSYGVTAVIPDATPPIHLRAAPSAGGLYPAEVYLVVRSWPGLEPGLYGYHPLRHCLVPLWEDPEVADHLAGACYADAAIEAAPACLLVTGVFERSRWRYQDRAYRRILLDIGHLCANACLAAPLVGLRTHLTGAFCDEGLAHLLRLSPDQEGALTVIGLNLPGEHERPSWHALPSGHGRSDTPPPLLIALHHASRLGPARPRLRPVADDPATELHARHGWRMGSNLTPGPGNLADDLAGTLVRRRSTRRFRRTAMSRRALGRILSAGFRPETAHLGPQPGFDRSRLMTFLAVLAVDGMDPGVYYLAPHALELRQVHGSLDRDTLKNVCLGQDLGGDAAAVVIHTADLHEAVRDMGDRTYRYLHMDAGLIGQRLNLAAVAEGLGASGIGGFFDDLVSRLLGVPQEQGVIYLTALGVPE